MTTADTNLSAREDPAAQTASASLAARQTTPAQLLVALVRREFWEHRALWMAPLLIAALLALLLVLVHSLILRSGLSDWHPRTAVFRALI